MEFIKTKNITTKLKNEEDSIKKLLEERNRYCINNQKFLENGIINYNLKERDVEITKHNNLFFYKLLSIKNRKNV